MRPWSATLAVLLWLVASPAALLAHDVGNGDKGYILCYPGVHLMPFAYLGAKHMVTGYDHLLFLVGVIFFLYRARDVLTYVTLFAVGHSLTLLLGVLTGAHVSSHLVDAVIGFSVVYKALDNLGVYPRWLGFQPSTKAATLVFGLVHGFGLATKILDLGVEPLGLLPNLIAFNIGVEAGQLVALGLILIAMGYWRRGPGFLRYARASNLLLVGAGVAIMVLQMTRFFADPGVPVPETALLDAPSARANP